MPDHTRAAKPLGSDAALLVNTYIWKHNLPVLGNWSTVRPVPMPVHPR